MWTPTSWFEAEDASHRVSALHPRRQGHLGDVNWCWSHRGAVPSAIFDTVTCYDTYLCRGNNGEPCPRPADNTRTVPTPARAGGSHQPTANSTHRDWSPDRTR